MHHNRQTDGALIFLSGTDPILLLILVLLLGWLSLKEAKCCIISDWIGIKFGIIVQVNAHGIGFLIIVPCICIYSIYSSLWAANCQWATAMCGRRILNRHPLVSDPLVLSYLLKILMEINCHIWPTYTVGRKGHTVIISLSFHTQCSVSAQEKKLKVQLWWINFWIIIDFLYK